MQQSKILLKLRKIIIKDLKQPILYRKLIKSILLYNQVNLNTIEDIHRYLQSKDYKNLVEEFEIYFPHDYVKEALIVEAVRLVGFWNEGIFGEDLIKLNGLLNRYFNE